MMGWSMSQKSIGSGIDIYHITGYNTLCRFSTASYTLGWKTVISSVSATLTGKSIATKVV